ncbi:unnamed protein product, partial [Acanthocheilonema viteae]
RLGDVIEKGVVDNAGNATRLRSRIDKKRSYTTSILVSPNPDRKLLLPQRQHSAEGSNVFSIASGAMTVEVGKDQFYLPNVNDDCKSKEGQLLLMGLCDRLNSVGKDSGNSHATMKSESETGTINSCIQSAGTALFHGADVSYI